MDNPITMSRERLRDLAGEWRANDWYGPLTAMAPGPVAHEVEAVARVAETGDAGGTLLQLRDAVETVVKFAALAFAREMIESGNGETARAMLLGPQLSFGTWTGIADTLATTVIQRREGVTLDLARLFSDRAYRNALGDFAGKRNAEIGHGAFRYDPMERVDVVEDIIRDRGLTQIILGRLAGLDWPILSVDAHGAREPLTGSSAIRDWHAQNPPRDGHVLAPFPCLLEKDDRILSLAPYVTARRCGKCAHQDVFLFDGTRRRGAGKDIRFDFLDYVQGHKFREPDAAISEEVAGLDEAVLDAYAAAVSSGLEDRTAIEELDKAVEAVSRYLSPAYLRAPVESRIRENPASVTWLRAPAHIGKSVFARAIADREAEHRDPLAIPGLRTVGIFIQRYWRADFDLFAERLRWELLHAFNLRQDRFSLIPALDREAEHPSRNLVEVVKVARQANPAMATGPLLIVVDGLDEVSATPEAQRLLDYLPREEELPPGVHVLLTSRRPGDVDCPAWLGERLGRRLEGGAAWI